jgi:hypothetical protein
MSFGFDGVVNKTFFMPTTGRSPLRFNMFEWFGFLPIIKWCDGNRPLQVPEL